MLKRRTRYVRAELLYNCDHFHKKMLKQLRKIRAKPPIGDFDTDRYFTITSVDRYCAFFNVPKLNLFFAFITYLETSSCLFPVLSISTQ